MLQNNINYTDLKTINNINFTSREIDIISCILAGRATKKIAMLLSISTKTVNNHIRNIMLKIGCNSRESIIDFIEKSNKFSDIKKHYSILLIKVVFEQKLKKISTIKKENAFCCLIIYYTKQEIKDPLTHQLEKHLELAGINVLTEIWQEDDLNCSEILCKNTVDFVIYNMTQEFINFLKINSNKTTVSNLTKFVKTNSKHIFLLSVNKDNDFVLDENFVKFPHIYLNDYDNYYLSVFEILKIFLPSYNFDKTIEEFKKQYAIFMEYSHLQQNKIEDNLLEKEFINSLKFKSLHKNFLLSKKILIILLMSFSFIGFVLNLNNIFGNKQNINSTIQQFKTNSLPSHDNNRFVAMDNVEAFHKELNSKNIEPNHQVKTVMFNLPPRNFNFTGRDNALQQIQEQLKQQNLGIITQAIAGLGGIGKTQLATEFAYIAAEKKEYPAIFWIPTETSNSIRNAYETIAQQLQIDIKGLKLDDLQTFVHNKIAKLYHNSKILFVLDNSLDYNYINDFLTKLQRELGTSIVVHVLITSRSQFWPNSTLLLDIFTKDEALLFIQKYLPNENSNTINTLAVTLHYFPLALSQAVAYIKSHTNISDYLKLYGSKQQKYLDKFPGNHNQYTESLWKTWDIALTKLSEPAKKILFMASYLYPDDIPIEFFDNLSVEERGNAIEDLRQHSFITLINSNSFKIHRLLQEVIKITLTNTNHNIFKKNFSELTNAINLLKKKFDFSYARHTKWNLCNKYVIHAQTLAENAIEIKGNFLIQGLQLYSQIAMFLTHIKQDNKNAKKILIEMSSLIKKNYSQDLSHSLVLANIKTHLGLVMRQLGDFKLSKKYLIEAIETYKKEKPFLSTDMKQLLQFLRWDEKIVGMDIIKYDYSFSFYNLAQIYQELGDYKTAKDNYKNASTLLHSCKFVNVENIYTVSLFSTLGNLYRYIGDINTAETNLALAKIYADKNFPSHIEHAYVYERLTDLLYYTGRYQEARKIAKKCLIIRSSVFSKNHYRIGYAKFKLGLILFNIGNIKKGIKNLKQAEVIYHKNFDKNHVRFIFLYIHMYHAFEINKEYDKALQYFLKAQQIAIKNWDQNSCNIVLANQFTPIEKFPILSKSEKNLSYYQQIFEITKQLFGTKHIRVARYHYLLGQIYENISDNNNAKSHYEQALHIATNQNFNNEILINGNKHNIEMIQTKLKSFNK